MYMRRSEERRVQEGQDVLMARLGFKLPLHSTMCLFLKYFVESGLEDFRYEEMRTMVPGENKISEEQDDV
jgi:hypothetical protein